MNVFKAVKQIVPPISPDKLTDARGSVVQSTSFDAWGRRRNPSNWTYSNIPATLFSRGYTGHSLPRPLGEHLDAFGLINMNGRMYDPILARFLSVDPYVQAADNTQSYNRYSYCWNNPLAYTDPTGYIRDPYMENLADIFSRPPVTDGGRGNFVPIDGGINGLYPGSNSFTHNGIWPKYGVGLGREAGPTYEEWKRNKEAKENINKLESVLFMEYYADEAVAYGYTKKDRRYVAIPLTNAIIKVYIGPDINFVYEAAVGGGIDWQGVTNASILLAGGVAEMVVGGVVEFFSAGTATPLTVPLILDGAGRTVANAQRLSMYFNGKNSAANAYPSSIGGALGKLIDMSQGVPFNQVGNGQAIFGAVNDFSAFLVTGGSGFALRNALMYPTPTNWVNYGFTFFSYNYSMYDNIKYVTPMNR